MNESGPGMGTMAKSTVVTWPLIQHILIYFTPFWPGKAMVAMVRTPLLHWP